MTIGFGVDKGSNNLGTTSADIRKIFGGIYTPGIISGCTVTTTSTHYVVSSGVAAIKIATGEIVLAPVPAISVLIPQTGSRTDIVYAKQRLPSIDGGLSDVLVSVTSSTLPVQSVLLKKFSVSSGNVPTFTGNIDYSIPYGATLGVLHQWQNTYDGNISIPLLREGQGSFTLPTDRRVKFSLTTVLSANSASGFDNSQYCEWYFLPNIDGGDFIIWTTDGLHQAWATYSFEHYMNLSAGVHTTSIGAGRMVGPGTAWQHYGLDGQGFGRRGQYYLVEDVGPAV